MFCPVAWAPAKTALSIIVLTTEVGSRARSGRARQKPLSGPHCWPGLRFQNPERGPGFGNKLDDLFRFSGGCCEAEYNRILPNSAKLALSSFDYFLVRLFCKPTSWLSSLRVVRVYILHTCKSHSIYQNYSLHFVILSERPEHHYG